MYWRALHFSLSPWLPSHIDWKFVFFFKYIFEKKNERKNISCRCKTGALGLLLFANRIHLQSCFAICVCYFQVFFFRRTTYCLCLCVCLFVVAAISNSISVLYCNRFYWLGQLTIIFCFRRYVCVVVSCLSKCCFFVLSLQVKPWMLYRVQRRALCERRWWSPLLDCHAVANRWPPTKLHVIFAGRVNSPKVRTTI